MGCRHRKVLEFILSWRHLFEGGKNTEPKWTLVDGSQISVRFPSWNGPKTIRSGDKHPIGSDCSACHDTVDDTMRIVKPEQHIDGMVQFTPVGGW